MFNTYEFIFAGESSREFGLILCDFDEVGQDDIAFGNIANIIETRTRSSIHPILHGIDYHEEPLEFKLVFGSYEPLDRYDMQRISMWLTGHQGYQWLMIDQPDMRDVQYYCLVTQLKPISVGWLPHAFQATIRCDSPYAYSAPVTSRWDAASINRVAFVNHSTIRDYLKPHLRISAKGTTFEIINHSDSDRSTCFNKLPAGGVVIEMDNERGIISDPAGEYNLYDGFNMNFFRLLPGENILEFKGNGVVELFCRYIYNTAG